MKRLFRTSKSGAVDPLPIPHLDDNPPQQPQNVRKSLSSLLMGGDQRSHVSPYPVDMVPPQVPRKVDPKQNDGWTMVNSPPDDPLRPSSQPFYLPPGAGPPSPQMRPLTPNRLPYISQPDLVPTEITDRDRGYSSASASGLGSDLESSVHGHRTGGTRSPLAQSYDTPKFNGYPEVQRLSMDDRLDDRRGSESRVDMHKDRIDHQHDRPEPQVREDHPQRRKFWGVAWGDVNKKRDKEDPEGYYAGYNEEERGRTGVREANDVGTAIKLLCGLNDPPMSNILDMCDRINLSTNPEAVAKEAARTLRKELKGGNDSERRAAARLWLIMMRNVAPTGFKQHATSKKFMASLETVLLPTKVHDSTRQYLIDILAALTYQYGTEKGCEGLSETWRKVKQTQDPDMGYPLAPEHAVYSPRPPPESYSHYMPDPLEDMRRLLDECTAAKESARVLSEALVYTRPEDLETKDVILEFYRKCFLANEAISNQMDWAQAEASRHHDPNQPTIQERTLEALLDAHSALAEVLKQHEDLRNMAEDERELRQVRERSKKETRGSGGPLHENQREPLLFPQPHPSSSREPSPAPIHRITQAARTRSPSPASLPLVPPPALQSQTTSRAASPLGKRIPGPRPLPIPQTKTSNQSLRSEDDDNHQPTPPQPSRKALGKRRVVAPDEDNQFNPDDMFSNPNSHSRDGTESDESIMADEVYLSKPVVYAYDAYEERQAALRAGGSAISTLG